MQQVLLSEENIHSVCRTCLVQKTDEMMTSIFDPLEYSDDDKRQIFLICELLAEVSKIKVDSVRNEVKLSTLVCTKCLETLKMVLDFRQKFIRNQRIFDEYVINKVNERLALSDNNIELNQCIKSEAESSVDSYDLNIYNCQICNQTFGEKHELEVHFKSHEEEGQSQNNLSQKDDCDDNNTVCAEFVKVKQEFDFNTEVEVKQDFDDFSNSNVPGEMMDIQGELSQNNAAKTTEHLLSMKSRPSYDKEIKYFITWKDANLIKSINETVMLAYFQELSKKYSPTSLWTKYSLLKSTLKVNYKIDISQFNHLISFLKVTSEGYVPKKSRVLEGHQVLFFMKNAPNEIHLLHKVVLVMGIFGRMRRDELVRMTIDDIEDKGSVLLVKTPKSKTSKSKGFTIVAEETIGALKLVREYSALRPTAIKERRFFLTYRNGRCTVQPVGKNTIGSIPTIVAKYLKLDNAKEYTGHCLRRTSSTLFVEAEEISQNIVNNTAKPSEHLSPVKSRPIYDKELNFFIAWKDENLIKAINEPVMMAYFQELSKKYSPNSLWTKYSLLKSTLTVNYDIDISQFNCLISFLKDTSKGYVPRKSRVLEGDQVIIFMKNAPNEIYLLHKVLLVMGIFGRLRRDDLVRMTIDDIEDKGSVLLVKPPKSKTSTAKGFTIVAEETIGALKLVRQYSALRPTAIRERRFFLAYRNGRCTAQPVGKNTIGSVPTIVAKYLKLDNAKEYTGHCLRHTAVALLVEAGASFETLEIHEKWKRPTVAE